MPNPDYAITRVSYDSDHSRITEAERKEYDADENVIRNPEKKQRQVIVSSIESGTRYYTTPPDGEGGVEWGDEVGVIELDGEKFIRTDGNDVKEDNLGDLQEY